MRRRWPIFVIVGLALILVVLLDMVMSVTPMAPSEYQAIQEMVARYDPPFPPDRVTWKWLHGWRAKLAARQGINASYRCLSTSVVVPEECRAIVAEPVMAPVYNHELTHADQASHYGTFGYLVKKIFNRRALEDEAVTVEDITLLLMSGEQAKIMR